MPFMEQIALSIVVYALLAGTAICMGWALLKGVDAIVSTTGEDIHNGSRRVIRMISILTAPARLIWHFFARQSVWRRWCIAGAITGIVGASLPVGSVLWYVYRQSGYRPNAELILDWHPHEIGHIYDRKGTLIMRTANNEFREVVPYAHIPAVVIAADIAAEDADFWTHEGYDKKRTLIAFYKVFFGKLLGRHYRLQGASTITQQVIRRQDPSVAGLAQREQGRVLIMDTFLTRLLTRRFGLVVANRTVRKLPEIRSAVQIENVLTEHFSRPYETDPRRRAKEAILALHINMAYFGHGVYGIPYASQFWFGKPMNELTPDEAAFLVSLLPAPEIYGRITDDPADRQAKVARRNEVLRRMVRTGAIGEEAYDRYANRPLVLDVSSHNEKTEAPAAVNGALKEMERLGFTQDQLNNGEIDLYLTVDRELQRIVTMSVNAGIKRYVDRFHADPIQMAVVVLRGSDAAIMAEYGGVIPEELYNNQTAFNRASRSRRQPGSTFKIFDITAAIAVGLTPDTIVSDTPFTVHMGNGTTQTEDNYDGKHEGPIPLWRATEMSRNLAFLHMMHDQVGHTPQAQATAQEMHAHLARWQTVDPGAAEAIKWAREMGVKSHLDPYISTVLGANGVTPLEMGNAIRTLCGGIGGIEAEPYLIERIVARNGTVLYTHPDAITSFPISQEKLEMIQALLRGTVLLPHGTGRSLAKLPVQVAGKTGTSSHHRDAWFVGCEGDSSGYSFAGWGGYDDFAKTMPGDGLTMENRASGGSVMAPTIGDIIAQAHGPSGPLGPAPEFSETVNQMVADHKAKAYPAPISDK